MSRKHHRSIDLTPESDKNVKRTCAERNQQSAISESHFWPDNDASFFSNVKLEDIFNGAGVVETAPFNSQASDNFQKSDSDDALFRDIPLSSPDTLANSFEEIDLYNLSRNEIDDIFHGAEDYSEPAAQNTQAFMDTIFKIPKTPERTLIAPPLGIKDESFISKSILEGIVQGTQYETCEQLRDRSMPQTQQEPENVDNMDWKSQTFADFQVKSETPILTSNELHEKLKVENVDNLDWDSQAFADFQIKNEVPSLPSKGSFYGLPEKVKQLIFEHKGINSLYEWQDECLNLPAIRKRKNLIYALPTSGGKTLVAEILMLRELLCCERNVLFILPYVSIVQEKVSAMAPFAIALNFLVDEYTAGKGKCPPVPQRKLRTLFIASIEKGAVLMDSLIDAERPHEIGLVVVDELHLIGERGRGATLEAFLTKVMFLKANIQIVGMSATIGNLNEISNFLNADVYTRGFRPVELREYIKCGTDVLEVKAAGATLEEMFVPQRTVSFNYSPEVLRADPDHLAGLVCECSPEHCCLVFCPTRKNCENVALLLSRIVPKQKFLEHRQSEKTDLMQALDQMCGILSPVLAKTLPYGIAYHHSGLTTDERKYIETAYRFGVITVICCTSTLAAGVNLPAKRVIIRAPYVGQEFMTLCRYKQMVGRAGRAGLGEAGESFLIIQNKDNRQVGDMLFSPMDKALSSLDQFDAVGLQSLILSVIGLNLADCRRDLIRLVNSTLLAVQAGSMEIAVNDLVLRILRDMFKHKVLVLNESARNDKANASDIVTTQDINQSSRSTTTDRRLFVGQTTRFKLTSIGRAAFKAGIDYKRAFVIYRELQVAQQQLILTSYAHLLYLIVSFNSNERGDELFAADAGILFAAYTALPAQEQLLFHQLGFTEAQAARLAKTQSVQGPLALKLNRLYKVLILAEILALLPLPQVSSKYKVERGTLQQLINQCTSAASAIVRLCEQLDEFWCYKALFERINHKMDRCGTQELEPLLELPAVKINRAKQLYTAGYRSIADVAKTRPMELVKAIEFMPLKVATEIISAAKVCQPY
ncbi:mus301 [Drosophila busckii]|uniref:Mus301 n=1 Tax=Drosophila busckii TaxID=30019 RepID=A0A0M3QW18_DROBS|nr:mus301 [Drosophila busckii]